MAKVKEKEKAVSPEEAMRLALSERYSAIEAVGRIHALTQGSFRLVVGSRYTDGSETTLYLGTELLSVIREAIQGYHKKITNQSAEQWYDDKNGEGSYRDLLGRL